MRRARGQVRIRHRTSNPEIEGSNPPGLANNFNQKGFMMISHALLLELESEYFEYDFGSKVKQLVSSFNYNRINNA